MQLIFFLKLSDKLKKKFQPKMLFQAFLPTKIVDKEQCVYSFMHKELIEHLPCYERAGGMVIQKEIAKWLQLDSL